MIINALNCVFSLRLRLIKSWAALFINSAFYLTFEHIWLNRILVKIIPVASGEKLQKE